ncbi:MAG: hypothetical protein U5K69_01370 [Balneolaceae bacterium]|nr:hypothetical protein [Balneolaceae bacterium]
MAKARFWGFESSVAYRFIPSLKTEISGRYLWGQDETVNEPALGILPGWSSTPKCATSLLAGRFFAEGGACMESPGKIAVSQPAAANSQPDGYYDNRSEGWR